jgi:hypothetical protein
MSDVCCPVGGGQPIDEVKYISMCDAHRSEIMDRDRRRAGIADLQYTAEQLKTPEGAAKLVEDVRFRLHAHPTKGINIKVTV